MADVRLPSMEKTMDIVDGTSVKPGQSEPSAQRKRVLLTGATGFIGAYVAHRLLQDNYVVCILVRPESAMWRIQDIRDQLVMYEGDISELAATKHLLNEILPDWIFHFAAYGAYSYQTDLQTIIQTNTIGTTNLVISAIESGCEAFVNAGSSSEYGYKDHAPSEDEWIDPNSHYSITKASATHFCRYHSLLHKRNVTTLRLYSVYGPYEEPTRLLPHVIAYARKGRYPAFVSPNIARDFVYIEDVYDAFIRVAAAKPTGDLGAIYNVGTGVQTTIHEVAALARQMFQISDEPAWGTMPDRNWDTNTWVANSHLIQAKLGWKPKYSFEHGFTEMVKWFENDPSMSAFYDSRILPQAGK